MDENKIDIFLRSFGDYLLRKYSGCKNGELFDVNLVDWKILNADLFIEKVSPYKLGDEVKLNLGNGEGIKCWLPNGELCCGVVNARIININFVDPFEKNELFYDVELLDKRYWYTELDGKFTPTSLYNIRICFIEPI